MILRSFILTFWFLICISFVTAIGITPALKDISFLPGQEVNISFLVTDASDDSFYDVSFRGGDLVQYSTLSTNSVKGNSGFVLTIRFPNSIEEPGQHTVSVSIKERPSESSFINTVIEVGSTIKVFVPYPGLYGELYLSVPDGNIDSQIPVEFRVINRGSQTLVLNKVFIDFISRDEKTRTLNFTPVDISVAGDRYFRKYLDTTGLTPGIYQANAQISYGGIIKEINQSFRIGSLFVNITNYTQVIRKGGIQKFYVSLENLWNSPILGAYVDVEVYNKLGENYLFRTPSIDLNAWEKKTIESYFDTTNLNGVYDVILNASYNERSTVAYGTLIVEDDKMLIYLIIGAIALVIIIIIYFIIRHLKKKK